MPLKEVEAIGQPRVVVTCFGCEVQGKTLLIRDDNTPQFKIEAERAAFTHFQTEPEHKVLIALFRSLT